MNKPKDIIKRYKHFILVENIELIFNKMIYQDRIEDVMGDLSNEIVIENNIIDKAFLQSRYNNNIDLAENDQKNNINCINCYNCINCVDCVKCVNCNCCFDCKECFNCDELIKSEKCNVCTRSGGMENCNNCNECFNLVNCNNCKKCLNCKDSNQCFKVNKGKELKRNSNIEWDFETEEKLIKNIQKIENTIEKTFKKKKK